MGSHVLLKRFGFGLPLTLDEERELWGKIWSFIMYNETDSLEFEAVNSVEGEAKASARRDQ